MTMQVFDSHLHIIDPRFPLVANQGYLPGHYTTVDYLARLTSLRHAAAADPALPSCEIIGGAIVSGSFQAYDQGYLLAALRELGKGFVGVTQLPIAADPREEPLLSDTRLRELAAAGVRAFRCNLFRGATVDFERVALFARRVYDLVGWHAELYLDARILGDGPSGDASATVPLSEIGEAIAALPAASIDHIGMHSDGLPAIAQLAREGVRIKATGFGRLLGEFEAEANIRAGIQAIVRANSDALMFGTDLPGTRARRPFAAEDLGLIAAALGDVASDIDDPDTRADDLLRRVLYTNAAEFYRVG